MKNQILKLMAALLGITVIIGIVAALHAIDKYPADKLAGKISFPQIDSEEMNCVNLDCINVYAELAEEDFLASQVTWKSDRGDVTLSMANLGISIPLEELAQLLDDLKQAGPFKKLSVYLFGHTYKLIPSIDPEALKAAFAESGIEQGQKNASYIYSNGAVQIDPQQTGYGIDTSALTALIRSYWEDDFTVPESTALPLRSSEPEIQDEDLQALLENAQAAAQLSFTLQGEWGGSWDLAMSDHIDWLLPGEKTDETTNFKIDSEKFKQYVDTDLAPDIEEEAMSVTITENEDGTYNFDGSARFGKTINREEFMGNIENAIAANESADVKIPIETTKPEVNVTDSLRERGITDLLEFGYTSFSGSPTNRIHNVNRGMNLFNGTVVKQGEEFSFTTLMGPIDAAHGWREELVIVGDETKPEYGGGLCQVSSTMFRAALYSGLPITYRKEHSYAVSYYAYPNGYGLDATVYENWPDLRFLNDTPGDILIQGYTDGNLAYFVFYGTNDNRSVQMEGPYYYSYVSPPAAVTTYTNELEPGVRKLEEHSHTGFQVDWYRTIFYGDGTQSERENIHTNYEARPEKWLEGKADDAEGNVEEAEA